MSPSILHCCPHVHTIDWSSDIQSYPSIIFVHGLAGNRETTWTDKSTGIFWPAHFLKNTLPNTRILTFGYDADLAHFWSVASQNCVRNHATNLTNAVAQLRGRTKTEERPIIFVTHSLGGLVFEDVSDIDTYLHILLPVNMNPR